MYDDQGEAGLQIETLIFNGKRHKPLPQDPTRYKLYVTEDDLNYGFHRKFLYESNVVCFSCHSQDDKIVVNEFFCTFCNGQGLVFDHSILAALWINKKIKKPTIYKCFKCDGARKVVKKSPECLICNGQKVSYCNLYV